MLSISEALGLIPSQGKEKGRERLGEKEAGDP